MKKVMVKRLMYRNLHTNEIIYGGEEYDGSLSDSNILGMIHELGKTQWYATRWERGRWINELYLMKNYPGSEARYPAYHIYVDEFYYNIETIWDKIKRILGL